MPLTDTPTDRQQRLVNMLHAAHNAVRETPWACLPVGDSETELDAQAPVVATRIALHRAAELYNVPLPDRPEPRGIDDAEVVAFLHSACVGIGTDVAAARTDIKGAGDPDQHPAYRAAANAWRSVVKLLHMESEHLERPVATTGLSGIYN